MVSPLWSTVSSHQRPCGSPGRSLFHQPHGAASAVTSRAAHSLHGIAQLVQAVGTDLLAQEPSLLWSPAGQASKLSPKFGG